MSRAASRVTHFFDRRTLIMGAAAALTTGCMTPGTASRGGDIRTTAYASTEPRTPNSTYRHMYAAIPNERFPVPAVDVARVETRLLRQEVDFDGSESPGTIVVDPGARYLYHVIGNGRAMRYGVGVGKEGFGWNGRATIQRKTRWPSWTPPSSMIAREPRLAQYADGMDPGLDNPLGARALYLYRNGRDTLYRIHGTNEPWSIGRAMSSGCIRLFNQDVIHLYDQVELGSPVVVRPHSEDISV